MSAARRKRELELAWTELALDELESVSGGQLHFAGVAGGAGLTSLFGGFEVGFVTDGTLAGTHLTNALSVGLYTPGPNVHVDAVFTTPGVTAAQFTEGNTVDAAIGPVHMAASPTGFQIGPALEGLGLGVSNATLGPAFAGAQAGGPVAAVAEHAPDPWSGVNQLHAWADAAGIRHAGDLDPAGRPTVATPTESQWSAADSEAHYADHGFHYTNEAQHTLTGQAPADPTDHGTQTSVADHGNDVGHQNGYGDHGGDGGARGGYDGGHDTGGSAGASGGMTQHDHQQESREGGGYSGSPGGDTSGATGGPSSGGASDSGGGGGLSGGGSRGF